MLAEKILVVDDEQTVCKSITKILSRKGYYVDNSSNVEEAMEKINNTSYDLIITDLMMPKTSGMELLEIIKENYPKLDVIMITGYASIDSAVRATKLGVADYIPKPFTPDELTSAMEKVLFKKKVRIDEKVNEREEQFLFEQSSEEILDVDISFIRSELVKRTSKEFVESLSHTDIPILKKRKESSKMEYCFTGDRMCEQTTFNFLECTEECPIERRERDQLKKYTQLPKEIVDVDIPFNIDDLEAYMTKDSVNCLDHSDMIRPALYRRNRSKKQTVLVIDDEPIVCQSIRKILNTQGYNVEEVCDADDALREMKLNKYDLVLLDLKIPKKDGMELLESIKEQYPNVPVVMITGYASIDKAIEATRLGAFQFIPKPFTPKELSQVTFEALAIR